MPLIGANGGLLGSQRSTNTSTAPGLWTPNEQVVSKRAGVWPLSGDPYFGYNSLLLHMDGSNGSTTFTDNSSSPLSVTANGNAQISTAQSKFGGASGYFDGSGDFLTASSSAAIQGSENFTIEAWLYPTAVTGSDRCIYETRGGSGFVLFINSSGNLQVFDSALNSTTAASTLAMTANAWQHFALVGSGSTKTYYINGTAAGSFTLASLATASSTRIAARNDGAAAFSGYIDDLRITKGVARYTSTFMPSTTAFPNA